MINRDLLKIKLTVKVPIEDLYSLLKERLCIRKQYQLTQKPLFYFKGKTKNQAYKARRNQYEY
jgi:hypothetical protein